MTASSTMTIRVSTELKDKLERIAAHTRRSKSWLAGEAIETYVARELQIVEGIERAIDGMTLQPGVPHEDVMAELRQIVADAEARKATKTA
ncbi:MAG: ribbon-helix-helix protein, CopG family [Asticcacaulis sp.]|uniref:CopG family ribbon-helix-helix protein n=1 Tax=Asticcacaulis sp. TaxID=1872648 RepID=UPI0039E43883